MNVLKPEKVAAIVVLLKNGVSQHEIHRKTGIDRKTIRKYAEQRNIAPQPGDEETKSSTPATGTDVAGPQSPPRRPPGEPPEGSPCKGSSYARSACEPYREWIERQVRLGRNAISIYQDLVELHGFDHKYNSVKRFVRRLRKKDPKQFDRLEFLPGEEAQVDYGTGAKTLDPRGRYRKPRLFVMTLKYSRRSFRKVVWKSSKETWARLHEEAFRYFGGCPQYVVLDNLKEGVVKPDIYEPALNPLYAAVLEHYGVVADPARVGDSDRKGTVENAVQHTQDTALKGRTFENIEAQNQWLFHWEERWAAPRIHGRAKRQVEAMFQEEKPYLQPLPLEGFRYFEQATRTVWDDGTVQVGRSYYSALPAPLHSEVIVRIYATEIEIVNPQTLEVLRRHQKSSVPGAVRMEESDRIFNPSRQTHFLLNKAARIGPETHRLCERWFEKEGRTGQRRMQGVVNLTRRHESRHIEEACRQAAAAGLSTARAVRRLVERIAKRENPDPPAEADRVSQAHRLIRPPEDYGAFWAQHAARGGNGRGSHADSSVAPGPSNRFIMTREQLRRVWENASWQRVIEVFGLEQDTRRNASPSEIWIKSPFSTERTASLHVNLEENIYKDFSSASGQAGGILNFCQDLLRRQGQEMNCYEVGRWMLSHHISVLDAADTGNAASPRKPPEQRASAKKTPNGVAISHGENKPIRVDLRPRLRVRHPALEDRRIGEGTCQYLGCGFLPANPPGSYQSPLQGRAVFQVRGLAEEEGRLKSVILTHVGRALNGEQETAKGKYWSYPFFKSLEIYNQDNLLLDPEARVQVARHGLVLVEGFFDAATLIEAGFRNVAALMGCQMSDPQADRLAWIGSHIKIPRIVLFFDHDSAGAAGAQKAGEKLRQRGFRVDTFDWNRDLDNSGGPDLTTTANKDPADLTSEQLISLRIRGNL
jgi:transposase